MIIYIGDREISQGDMMKIWKIFAVLVIVGMLMPISMIATADTEPNDDFSSAESIGIGEYTGTVCDYYDSEFNEHEDVDYYKVTVPAGKSILVSAYANASNSVTVYLYDGDRQELGLLIASDGALDREFYDRQSSEEYSVYLKVYTYDDMVSYTMNIEFRPSDVMSFAENISAGQRISDTIYDISETHWYRIDVPAHKALKLSCSSSGDDIYVSIYKEDGTIISMDDGTSYEVEVKNNGDSEVTAYIKVDAISTNKVTYTLQPEFEDISSADGTSPSVSDDSPTLGLPMVFIGLLAVVLFVGIRRRKS